MELTTYIIKNGKKTDITTHTNKDYIMQCLYNTIFGKYIVKRDIRISNTTFNYEDDTYNFKMKYSNGFVEEYSHVGYIYKT